MIRLLDEIPYNTIPKEDIGDIQTIAHYSEIYDGRANFQSVETLRHFARPSIPQDLAVGYEGWVAQHLQRPTEIKPFGIKSLDYMIEACLESESADQLLDCQVVTKRGTLLQFAFPIFRYKKSHYIFFSIHIVDFRRKKEGYAWMFLSLTDDCLSRNMAVGQTSCVNEQNGGSYVDVTSGRD
jgi:hypothetical protein